METIRVVIAIFFTLSLAKAEPSTGQVLKGSVKCLDCKAQGSDLSGIQVLVKCDEVKRLAMAYTEKDGAFETELPSDGRKSDDPSKCTAKIAGGPYQLYVSANNSTVQIVKGNESGHLTTAKPLNFYESCPVKGKCVAKNNGSGSSKAVDLPDPKEDSYIPLGPIVAIP